MFSRPEMKVGLMVIVGVSILCGLIFALGGFHIWEKGYRINVLFNDVAGLNLSSPVRLAGMEVGEIKEMSIKDGKVLVELWLRASARLRQDSKITINSLGLIGEKYIDISMGSQDQPFLPDGSTVIGVDPVSVGEMLSTAEVITRKFEGALTTLNKMFGGEKTREKIGKILLNTVLLTSNLNTVVAENRERVEKAFSDLSEVSTNIITLTDDIEKLSLEVKGVIKENREDIRVACKKFREASLSLKRLEAKLHTLVDESGARLRNASNTFERASANLERITSEAGEEVGGILSEWREITNENKAKINSILTDLREVSRELRGSAESLNLIAKKIKSGEGVIGKLIYDDEIANDLTQTANSFRELAEELKRSPWKLLRKE